MDTVTDPDRDNRDVLLAREDRWHKNVKAERHGAGNLCLFTPLTLGTKVNKYGTDEVLPSCGEYYLRVYVILAPNHYVCFPVFGCHTTPP